MSDAPANFVRDGMTPARIAKAIADSGIELNERYLRAVISYLNGKPKSLACEEAGLPVTKAWTVFQSAKMQAAIGVVMERFLVLEAAPAAVRCLHNIVQDEKVAAGIRVQAANSLLDRAGFNSKRLSKDPGAGEMDITRASPDELRAEIARLEKAMETQMKDVTNHDSAPDSEPISDQVLDMFE